MQQNYFCTYCNQTFFTSKTRFALHVNTMHPGKTETSDEIDMKEIVFDSNVPNTDSDNAEPINDSRDTKPINIKNKTFSKSDKEDDSMLSDSDDSSTKDGIDESQYDTNDRSLQILQKIPETMYLAYQKSLKTKSATVDNFRASISAIIENELEDELLNDKLFDLDESNYQHRPNYVQATDQLEAAVASVGQLIQCNNSKNNCCDTGRDTTLLYLNDFDDKKSMSLGLNNDQLFYHLQLLQLLQKSNAPLHLYDSIMQWSRQAAIVGNFRFEAPSPTRSTLLNELIETTNMKPLLPTIIDFELPHAKQHVKIILHDIQRSIHSLLTDLELMKEENLIFKNSPLEDPNNNESDIIEDVNDGTCFKEAYRRLCKDGEKDVLCPLILFIDKTHTDTKGNQTLEPICLTLGIFKKEIRRKENAWRIIGFVPSTDTIANSKLDSNEKQSDYHSMMNVVLAPLCFMQSFQGISFQMKYNQRLFDVCLKIPILFICGDSEGQDKLVGRRLVYSNLKGAKHICRYCSVPYEKTEDPHTKATKTMASTIEQYLLKKKFKKLNDMGYLLLDYNALHKLQFCDDINGITGSLPADLLHTWQLGLYIYISEGLFGSKQASIIAKTNRKRKIAAMKRGDVPGETHEEKDIPQGQNLQGADVSTRNVFNPKEKDRFDNLARQYGKLLSQQADRDLPRTFFPSGITGEKKKNGHEMQGMVLNILCIFLSSENKNFLHLFGGDGIGDDRLGYWILLLERFIMVEEFLKQSKFNKKDVKSFKRWFPHFLTLFKRVVDRKTGSGFKLLKFHLCTHFADDILKWGCPSSFDSATGESNHKTLKKHARRTQKNINVLVEQTGMRYVENLAIHHAISRAAESKNLHIHDNQKLSTNLKFIHKAYRCNPQGVFDITEKGNEYPTTKWHDQEQFSGVQELLQKHVLPHVAKKTVEIYTGAYCNGVLYHGNPSFKSTSWQDWAYCNWGDDYGICPVQLLAFVDLRNLKKDLMIEGSRIEGGYFAAIIHMVEKPLEDESIPTEDFVCSDYSAHKHSWLFFNASKMIKENKPIVTMVHMETIVGPCIGIPLSVSTDEDKHQFLFLRPRKEWSETLCYLMDKSQQRREVC